MKNTLSTIAATIAAVLALKFIADKAPNLSIETNILGVLAMTLAVTSVFALVNEGVRAAVKVAHK